MKPRLLDLFCCAGGAGMGYARAGFEITGYTEFLGWQLRAVLMVRAEASDAAAVAV